MWVSDGKTAGKDHAVLRCFLHRSVVRTARGMSAGAGRQKSPVFAALAIQLVIFIPLWLLRPLAGELLGYMPPLLWVALAGGLLAGIVTRGFGFSAPWVIGQVGAPPLLVLALALDIPSWVFPLVLLLLVLLFWNVAGNRVPLFLTNRLTYRAIEEVLPDRPLHFVDLGSGLGGILRYLATRRPDARFSGLETAPLPFALSWLMGKFSGSDNLEMRYRDIFREDLSQYDVVYCFLSPVPMPALFEKARAEMKPGSLFISNSFTVPDHQPDEVVEVMDRRRTKLLVWRM
ncbi:MAG: trans-aconitate methyltransferase [Sneathiella sp.]|nr:trans-aconitate methyltransferase [Sneathiella sp.]